MAEKGEISNEKVAKKNVVGEVIKEEKSVEEICQLGPEKREVKEAKRSETKEGSKERMALVSEKGLWFLRSAV